MNDWTDHLSERNASDCSCNLYAEKTKEATEWLVGKTVKPEGQYWNEQGIEDVDAHGRESGCEEVSWCTVHMAAHFSSVHGIGHRDNKHHRKSTNHELIAACQENQAEPVKYSLLIVIHFKIQWYISYATKKLHQQEWLEESKDDNWDEL